MKKFKSYFFLILITIGIFCFYTCKKEKVVSLKVMSYNIRHGEGLDTILDLSRQANIIKSIAPDICGIQEVDDFCLRSGNVRQTEYLAQNTNMLGTFGKFMDLQQGEYGMATLTTKPIISTKILKLPDGKFEPRTAIVHKIKMADGCIITFANVHFDWITEKEGSINRLKQSKALVKYLDSLNRPTVITGDFNCTPNSPTMTYFASQGFEFVTKGIDNLSFQGKEKAEIDHLIYKNFDDITFTKKNAYLLKEPIASDHRPFIIELEVTY
jgi:endonuclease/exonuclease/phosphatase family metal-dependent hydrolase